MDYISHKVYYMHQEKKKKAQKSVILQNVWRTQFFLTNDLFSMSETSSVHNLFQELEVSKSSNESQSSCYANVMTLLCVIYHQTDNFVVPKGNER